MGGMIMLIVAIGVIWIFSLIIGALACVLFAWPIWAALAIAAGATYTALVIYLIACAIAHDEEGQA
jgi:hypothetical protein